MEKTLAALRSLAEPSRLRLLALCATGEHSVGDLVHVLGQSQPRVSRHLKLMCDAGLLERMREGNFVYYRRSTSGNTNFKQLVDAALASLPASESTLELDQTRLEQLRQARAIEAANYFRDNAANWHKIRSLHIDEAEVEATLIAMLPKGGVQELIDIGTGTGRILEVLSPFVSHGVGIDQSRTMLSVARTKLGRTDFTNVHVRHADMYRLPIADQSVDLVTIHQVLHYAENPAAVFAEASRILRGAGRLIVADFAPHDREDLREQHAHRRLGFSDEEIENWAAAAGLHLAEVRRLVGNPLTVVLWQSNRREFNRSTGQGMSNDTNPVSTLLETTS